MKALLILGGPRYESADQRARVYMSKGMKSREVGRLSDQQTSQAVSFCCSSRGSGRAEKQGEARRGRREKGEQVCRQTWSAWTDRVLVGSGSEVRMVERRLGRAWRGRARLKTRAERQVGRSKGGERGEAMRRLQAPIRADGVETHGEGSTSTSSNAGTARQSAQCVSRRACSVAV